MRLIVEVIDIKGNCPVYKIGNTFSLIDGYKLKSEKPICMHSLASFLPIYSALSKGIKPKDLGLGEGEKAYFQCLDPYLRTGGGTVIFSVYKQDE
ncbi:TIGR04076 family protein [candidate division WOR-3 bacterium]|nr:TIGR04076 family protein [candidate division WOR-3 bacterium]